MPNYSQTQSLVESDGVGLGTKPSQPATGSIVVSDFGNSIFRGVDVTLTSVPISMVYDSTVNGSAGTQLLYTAPKGLTTLMGAVGSLTITAAQTTITSTAGVLVSVGTVVASGSVLSTTEANVIASTAATLTASTSSPTLKMTGTEFAAGVFDGTSTANSFRLNLAIPPAGTTNHGTLTVSGVVRLSWVNGGGFSSRLA